MGWEKRGNGRYYYTKERRGGRVVSSYVGAGPAAALIAEIEQSRREVAQSRAKFERDVQAAELGQFADLDQAIADVQRRISEAVAVELQALGFHQHKRGEWRKRRANNNCKS